MGNIIKVYDIINQVRKILSARVFDKLSPYFYFCFDVDPAIKVIQADIESLEIELARNKQAIAYLNKVKGEL